jgi:hypothetical protein
MIKGTLGFGATGCVAAGPSLPSGRVRDERETELSGTVTNVKFTNPHGSLALAVKNQGGSSTEWVMTLGSATALAQRGIGQTGPNALHTRDEIK